MTSNEILKADVLDILFDNRNKQYGAYVLRKNYNHRLGMALGISLSSIFIIFFLTRLDYTSDKNPDDAGKDVVIIEKILPPGIKKPEPPIPKRSIPVPQTRTQKLTTFEIKKDDLVKTTVPDQMSLINSAIGNKTFEGVPSIDMPVIKQTEESNSVKTEPKTNSFLEPVEREPQFPGGLEAWLNFLRKNLVAPEELEPGEKKTVSVRFFVSNDGSVTAFEVLQSAGKSFDNEVIRVLKKMPKWKPAIQNGQAVARAFTQPVTFIGVEQ